MKVVQWFTALIGGVCLLLAPATAVQAQDSGGHGDFQAPTMGDLVVLPDAKTLVVSVPSAAQLVYYDTVNKTELKKVDEDFQPAAMAVQGDKLFVVNKGTATIEVVEAATGKAVKEIKVSGSDPIEYLACHPSKGLLYAATKAQDVYSIDPEAGKATKTAATGETIGVDPPNGDFVYTGIFSATKDRIIAQEVGGHSVNFHLVRGHNTTPLLKYKVDGADLKLVAANQNAGSGGPWFSVSRDGKYIAMSGPYRTNPAILDMNIMVFETSDLTTPAGTLDHSFFPRAIAFHPQLDLVATIEANGPAYVFNAKSHAKKETFNLPGPFTFPAKVIFGGEGRKLISAVGMVQNGRQDATVAITFHDLNLTDDQKEQLKKALNK